LGVRVRGKKGNDVLSYKDLQDFVKILEEKNLFRRVQVEADRDFEITEIIDRVSKAYGPAILYVH
jgi:4-hydroxy-3-polyprenylbenzoate decarboxylase